jgi:hypothetical protein
LLGREAQAVISTDIGGAHGREVSRKSAE